MTSTAPGTFGAQLLWQYDLRGTTTSIVRPVLRNASTGTGAEVEGHFLSCQQCLYCFKETTWLKRIVALCQFSRSLAVGGYDCFITVQISSPEVQAFARGLNSLQLSMNARSLSMCAVTLNDLYVGVSGRSASGVAFRVVL
jgi:hypothetical protein